MGIPELKPALCVRLDHYHDLPNYQMMFCPNAKFVSIVLDWGKQGLLAARDARTTYDLLMAGF